MASFQVTLYSLFLGDQDSVTGHYRKGYVLRSAEVPIVPRNMQNLLTGMGFYCRRDAVGFTEYNVKLGDILLDDHGFYYQVMGLAPYTWGDEFAFYVLDLSRLQEFPFISGFFGFEDEDHGTLGYKFESGFQRGFWAL